MTPDTLQSTLTFDDLGFYQKTIVMDTGCAPEDAFKVERIMRDFVLHSTLDWLSRPHFRREARRAYKILQDERPQFEEYFATLQKQTAHFFAQDEAHHQESQTTA